jgi:hypothetical protein
LETSIIELVKILFYLLVQKHNNNSANIQYNNEEGEMGEKDEEGMDEKLVCSLIVNGDEEESVRGLMSSDLDNSLSMEK